MNKFLRMRDESLFRGSHGVSRGTKVGSIFAHREEGGSKENLLPTSEDHKNNYYGALWGGDQVNFFMT